MVKKLNFKNLNLLGYACGLAAGNTGCGDGPVELQKIIENIALFYPDLKLAKNKDKNNYFKVIAELSTRLAKRVGQSVLDQQKFLVFAGDHSCAIGTWSGAAHALLNKPGVNNPDIGLIWIDAHMDAHIPETSPSGNIHGMPVASLLGYGDNLLTQILNKYPKIKPENFCFIGIRSYESEEESLIKKLNIKTYYMTEVNERGLDIVFKEAKERITQHTDYYGLSIDLDGIDPEETPGVGTPEADGIHAKELSKVLEKYCHHDKNLLGAEITEFNPHEDIQHKTRDIIVDLSKALFS